MSDKTAELYPTDYEIVGLSVTDVHRCFSLSSLVGWNQTVEDWRVMLDTGIGIGIEMDGDLVATAIVLPYPPDIAWISMVIVASQWRRRGLGTTLMRRSMSTCSSLGYTAFLDATEYGEPVYRSLGFVGEKRISRLVCKQTNRFAIKMKDISPSNIVRLSDPERFRKIDERNLGGNRWAVIKSLIRREMTVNSWPDDALGQQVQFVTGRLGLNFYQIGPLLAPSTESAVDTVKSILGKMSGPVVIDVPDSRKDFLQRLDALGFRVQRSFIRMHFGADHSKGDPDAYYAIAGPEFG